MATVIDELIVELKLDPTQFDQGTKDAAQKLRGFEREHDRHSKRVAKNTEDISQAFQRLQGRLLSIASLFMGGMGVANFTDQVIRLTAHTGYLATSLGLTTVEITKWQAVGAQTGASVGEMAASIKSVRDAQSDLRLGRPSGVQKFAYMTHNNPGPAVDFTPDTDPTKFMLDVSRWLEYHKQKGPNEYATAQRAASSMLGFGQGTMNTLAMGPEALEKHLKAMEKYAPTDEEIKRFQELQEAMAKATTAVEALGRSIIALLTPGLIKFIDTWKDIIDTFREKGFVAGVRRYNQAMSESNAENMQTVKGWGSRAYNWGRRKLGLSVDETPPSNKPATFNERWSGTGSEPGSVGDAAPSDVLEKAREVALSGGPDAVASFMARQGYPKSGAWCGEFAAATVKAAGGTPPKNPQIASNWRNYGREVSDPQPGDIAVRRGAPTGSTGSHVTIVEELNKRGFVGLGGNQRGGMHSQFPRSSYQYYRGEAPTITKLGGAAAAARVEQSTINNSDRSSETHVGEIKVRVPPGTDGKGIAQEVTESLRRLEPAHERQD